MQAEKCGPIHSETVNNSGCLSVCVSGCVGQSYRETRLCLALLYGLLSQYQLREAQELGDHMARLVLQRTGHTNNSIIIIFFKSFFLSTCYMCTYILT